MSAPTRDELFDSMMKRADKMFSGFDTMIESLFNGGKGFTSTTVTTTLDSTEGNDAMEYKAVSTKGLGFKDERAIEEWLNAFGADGWDLNGFEFGCAIFSRFIDEVEE